MGGRICCHLSMLRCAALTAHWDPGGHPWGGSPAPSQGGAAEPPAATNEGPPPPQPSSLRGCTGQSQPRRRGVGSSTVCASGCWGSWECAGCTNKRFLLWVSCTPSCYNINCCALPGLGFPLTTKRQAPLSVSNTSQIPQHELQTCILPKQHVRFGFKRCIFSGFPLPCWGFSWL